ncbi:hypothetical protein X777_15708 [Ooceraea biroi]|uniref:Uncharacterized protein n=1 Tax=Ooceraea biroi TaxID=2015173 RepID=A0A026WSQ8_OOCBI|nr:hypothetical protein X777_15708 [Ooceraea biroi]
MGRVVSCGPALANDTPLGSSASPMADGRRRRYLYASGPGCRSGNMLRRALTALEPAPNERTYVRTNGRTDERTNERTDADALLALCASTHRTAPHDARTHARTRVTVP